MNLLTEIKKRLAPASLIDEQDIRPEHNLETDLGLDSFGMMEVLFDLETAFDLEIADCQIKQFGTVQDVVDYIGRESRVAEPIGEKK